MIKVYIILFLSFFAQFSASAIDIQKKYYLGVFIGNYEEKPNRKNWSSLSSANDEQIILSMLNGQGFENEHSIVLRDQDATKLNLLKAIDKLYNILKQGDVLYFHFSGHGQQVKDFKKGVFGDDGRISSDEWDGKDEALVLYDGIMEWEMNYNLRGHFVDDEIGWMLDKFSMKVGKSGQVIAVFDCCHSGTASRGEEDCKYRGVSTVCSPDDRFDLILDAKMESQSEIRGSENASPVFCFFGCSSMEKNQEYQGYGSLSLFLVQSLNELENKASYRNLFSMINEKMALFLNGAQSPSIEGDNLDQLIFSGNFVEQQKFFDVSSCDIYRCTVKAGLIESVQVGDSIGFFSNQVVDFRKEPPLLLGIVNKVGALECEVESKKIFENPKMYRAVVMKKAILPTKIKVLLDIHDRRLKKEFKKKLIELPFIELVEGNVRRFVIEMRELNGLNQIVIKNYQGEREYILRDMKPIVFEDEKSIDQVIELLKMTVRADFFKDLTFDDPNIQSGIELELIKVTEQKADQFSVKARSGDNFKIKIINHGSEPFYVNAVDIQPNGIFGTLGESKNKNLFPGKEMLISVTGIQEPIGMENIKILCSNRPLDLSSIMSMGKPISRGSNDDLFLKIFNDGVSGTRGCQSESIGIDTYNCVFEITK